MESKKECFAEIYATSSHRLLYWCDTWIKRENITEIQNEKRHLGGPNYACERTGLKIITHEENY
jgi:hypothetical protein